MPGGGVALLYATRTLDKLKVDNHDQQVGIDIVKRAIQQPTGSALLLDFRNRTRKSPPSRLRSA